VFGELVEGWEVAEAINKLSRGKKDNFAGCVPACLPA
jgi:hypothetical protein